MHVIICRPYSCPCPGAMCHWSGSVDEVLQHLGAQHSTITTLLGVYTVVYSWFCAVSTLLRMCTVVTVYTRLLVHLECRRIISSVSCYRTSPQAMRKQIDQEFQQICVVLQPGMQKPRFKKKFLGFLAQRLNTKVRPKSTWKHLIHILLKTNLQWAKDEERHVKQVAQLWQRYHASSINDFRWGRQFEAKL